MPEAVAGGVHNNNKKYGCEIDNSKGRHIKRNAKDK